MDWQESSRVEETTFWVPWAFVSSIYPKQSTKEAGHVGSPTGSGKTNKRKSPKSILLSLAKVQEKENTTETNKKFQPPLYNPGFFQTDQSTSCSKALDTPGSRFELRYHQEVRATHSCSCSEALSLLGLCAVAYGDPGPPASSSFPKVSQQHSLRTK